MTVEDKRWVRRVAERHAPGTPRPALSKEAERWIADLRDKPDKSTADLALIHYLQHGGDAVRRK